MDTLSTRGALTLCYSKDNIRNRKHEINSAKHYIKENFQYEFARNCFCKVSKKI